MLDGKVSGEKKHLFLMFVPTEHIDPLLVSRVLQFLSPTKSCPDSLALTKPFHEAAHI